MRCANPHCQHEAKDHYNGHDCMRCRCSRFIKPAEKRKPPIRHWDGKKGRDL
jgi:hypothetical protein